MVVSLLAPTRCYCGRVLPWSRVLLWVVLVPVTVGLTVLVLLSLGSVLTLLWMGH